MILPILLAATIIAFAGYIYKFPPTKTPSPTLSSNSICEDYSDEPVSKLRLDLIHTMANGYRDKQLQSILKDMTDMKYDAHSIWFDLETLKKFIYHIEINTKRVKRSMSGEDLKKLGKLGIRIYYSRYPNEIVNNQYPDLADLPSDYKKLHTLLMLPTLERDGIHMDFNPDDDKSYTLSKDELKNYFLANPTDRIPALGVFENLRTNRATISQNHGGLIPPADGSGEAI